MLEGGIKTRFSISADSSLAYEFFSASRDVISATFITLYRTATWGFLITSFVCEDRSIAFSNSQRCVEKKKWWKWRRWNIPKLISNSHSLLFGIFLKLVLFVNVQSVVKLFKHLQQYLRFFSGLIDIFYYLMLIENSMKLKDHDLTNIYDLYLTNIYALKKCLRYEFFDTDYLKSSNNFTADCNIGGLLVSFKNQTE